MADQYISKIKVPSSNDEYVIKDSQAWPLFSELATEENKLVTMSEMPNIEVDTASAATTAEEYTGKALVISHQAGGSTVITYLPAPPTTPGVYGLMATVNSEGKATYSWIDDLVRLGDTSNGGEV